jgi:hypothetical protein
MVECNVHPDLLVRYIRSDPQPGQMSQRALFQADALPDSTYRAVPALLSMGDFGEGELGKEIGVVARINDPDHQLIRSITAKAPRDIEVKRQVATFVLANLPPVEPDRREVVDSSKVEVPGGWTVLSGCRDLRPPVRQIEEPPIPGDATVVAQVLVLSLPGSGNPDLSRFSVTQRGGGETLLGIGIELPLAVQINPLTIHV